ncbi:MAG: AMP-binding protein [Pseudomonadales bacterium]|jgi:bile acid-coenzyme A ligase|nr:AMP-binding protein [Pseudomonadales bacterium]
MPELSMGRAVDWLAEQDPERPAITHEGRTVTRAELARRTNRLARAYAALGVGQDDLVTIALPNGIAHYEAAIACWKLGATPQPVSARLPFVERDAIVALADPALVVGVPAGTHGDRPTVDADFEADPALDDGPLPDRIAAAWKAPTSGGSTGRPKIIVAGQPATIDPTALSAFGQRPDGVQLVPGPLYHNAPFAFSTRALCSGNHLVVLSRFDAEAALAAIEQHRVDWTLLVPTMMQRIWRLGQEVRERYDVSSLAGVLHLAAPCPAWLKQAWIDWLGPERVWELYAGTEAQGVTIIRGDEWLAHPGSVGRPEAGTMRILDEDGRELPPGEVGEIWMRPKSGPGSTYRYLGAEPKAIGEGWESLGDLGRFDEDGYLYLADRLTDMILTGGANVYPAEVEAAIDAFPGVRSSCVVGLPDDDLGARVHAIVDTAGTPLDEDALLAHLGERLARYKIPRSLEVVDQPVRDDAGKVRRAQLRAERIA